MEADGADEIAWHTDGRTFLGDTPTIASLSLGASAHFQLRRMRNVWPVLGGGDDGIDPGETCDGPDLGMADCQSEGFDGGTLACGAVAKGGVIRHVVAQAARP